MHGAPRKRKRSNWTECPIAIPAVGFKTGNKTEKWIMLDKTPYIEAGFKNRREYLESLCEEYGRHAVIAATACLPASEDFDGLISTLEDYAEGDDFE